MKNKSSEKYLMLQDIECPHYFPELTDNLILQLLMSGMVLILVRFL